MNVRIKRWWNTIVKVVSHPAFSAFLNIIMLIAAFYAIILASKSLNQADEQFKLNSDNADSLFKYQLRNAKELNDGLISQINQLQDVTRNQVSITDKQLKVSKAIYQSQLYADRPQVTVTDSRITDTTNYDDKHFNPTVIISYKNFGRRPAINFNIRSFIISPDISKISVGSEEDRHYNLAPDEGGFFRFGPSIPKSDINKFFICYDYQYYDDILDQYFVFSYYLQHNQNILTISDDKYVPKLKDRIDWYLRLTKKRLFGEKE